MTEISDEKEGPCGPRRGRPPKGSENTRRTALLAAAEEVFLEKGLAASMDDIAKRAGVSKKTIYGCVATKELLFAGVIHARIENSQVHHLPETVAGAREIEEALVQFFVQLARFVLSPPSVRLYRTVAAEATRFPELARTYYEEGPVHMINIVGAWLEARIREGWLAIDEPYEAASILGGSVIAAPLRNLTLEIAGADDEAVIEKRARATVRYFLNGALAKR